MTEVFKQIIVLLTEEDIPFDVTKRVAYGVFKVSCGILSTSMKVKLSHFQYCVLIMRLSTGLTAMQKVISRK